MLLQKLTQPTPDFLHQSPSCGSNIWFWWLTWLSSLRYQYPQAHLSNLLEISLAKLGQQPMQINVQS